MQLRRTQRDALQGNCVNYLVICAYGNATRLHLAEVVTALLDCLQWTQWEVRCAREQTNTVKSARQSRQPL